MNEINVRKNIREERTVSACESYTCKLTHIWLAMRSFFRHTNFHISYRCLSCELNCEALISKCVSNTHKDQCNRGAENDVFFALTKLLLRMRWRINCHLHELTRRLENFSWEEVRSVRSIVKKAQLVDDFEETLLYQLSKEEDITC